MSEYTMEERCEGHLLRATRAVSYSTVQYSAVQYSTVQYSTIKRNMGDKKGVGDVPCGAFS